MSKKVLLVILDGWGISPDKKGNAIWETPTPFFDRVISSTRPVLLKSAAQNVGLPWGEAGNSEVGHLNIGLGRVILQDLPQIDASIKSGSFFNRPVLKNIAEHLKKTGGALHILGLASDGAVHAHINHFLALMDWSKQVELGQVYLHLITDGRDTPAKTAMRFINQIEKKIQATGVGKIATISGRFFTMDRDKRWDRTEKAYWAIAAGQGKKAPDASSAVDSAYAAGQDDEFIEPKVLDDYSGITSGDVLIFTNYRSDRALQLTKAFVDPNFNSFARSSIDQFIMATMTNYEDNLPCLVIFNSVELNNPQTNPLTDPLAKILADGQIKQLHLAETEKYAHVTHFFNGGVKEPFVGEERILVPSPKVATYDQKPEMSANELTAKLLDALQSKQHRFIVINFANPDMVGHTGNFGAAKQAVSVVDSCLARIVPVAQTRDYYTLITADHGNADLMIVEETNEPHKEHTIAPVPLLFIGPETNLVEPDDKKIEAFYYLQPAGILADVAPSILALMSLKPASEMNGISFLPAINL